MTNSSPAISRYFKDFGYVISPKDEAAALFLRLRYGASQPDLERARSVLAEHTWRNQLEAIVQVVF